MNQSIRLTEGKQWYWCGHGIENEELKGKVDFLNDT